MFKKAPQHADLSIYAIRRADHKDSQVQDLQCPLHLRRKISVSRGIEQRIDALGAVGKCPFELRLLAEDRDTAGALHLVRVQEGITVVDAAHFPDASAQI